MTIQEIAKQLDTEPKLQFNLDLTIDMPKEEFITTKIFDFNNLYDTVSESESFICVAGSWRSIGDMYLITKYYYPDTTFIEFLKIFYKDFKITEKNDIYVGHYCSTINKRVFKRNTPSKGWLLLASSMEDEWGKTLKQWLDELKEIVD